MPQVYAIRSAPSDYAVIIDGVWYQVPGVADGWRNRRHINPLRGDQMRRVDQAWLAIALCGIPA